MTKDFRIMILTLAALGLIFYFWKPAVDGQYAKCIVRAEEKIVRGNSLTGLIEEGEAIKILFGFYDCREIRREDIVAYKFSGQAEPIIKIVKGLPGDKFGFKKAGNYWQILINGKIVKNSKGEPYQLNESSYNFLNLYAKDYKGIIPPSAYLILGNLTGGSFDSSRFGLVSKNEILGMVAK